MGKALRTAGAIVGVAALVVATGGLAAFGGATLGGALAAAGSTTLFGVSASTLATASALMTGIGTSLSKPSVGDIGKGTQVDFKADANAGIPYVVGRTGVGGQIVYPTTAAEKNHLLCYLTVYSLGPVQGIVGFKANGQALSFVGDNAVEAPYHNMMWTRFQLGGHAPAAFFPPAVPPGGMSEWTAAHKLTGLTASWWALAYDKNGKTYPNGTPKPQAILDGVLVYDPRLDSTYPGGSGPCRAGQEATYVFSENPFLHALTWALGRFQNGKRVMGLGAPAAMIEVPTFVEAANVADANGWKIGGVVYSTDRKWEVFKAMLQAGGGWPVALGAKIGCGVSTPRVSLAVLTGDDAVGDVTVTGAQAKRDRWNAVVPSYRSEDHDYQLVPAAPIVVPEWVAEDRGVQRTMTPEFPLVPNVDQAAQLGVYAVANSRELGPVTIPCKPQWARFAPNDCITVDEPDFGLVGREMVIVDRHRDWSTGVVTLTLMSETSGKHPFALGKTGTPPPTPDLDGLDGRYIPPASPGSWDAVGTVLAGPEGALPVIRVTGAADAELISAIIVDYREQLTAGPPATWGPWITQEYPPSATEILVTGLKPGGKYQVRVRYRNTYGAEDPDAGLDLGEHQPGGVNAATVGVLTAAQIEAAVEAAAQALADALAVKASVEKTAEALMTSVLKQSAVVAALKRAGFTPEGLPLGPVAIEQKTITGGVVQDLNLIGFRTDDGGAFRFNLTLIEVADGVTLASSLDTLSAADADNLALIQAEETARVTATDALAETIGILGAKTGDGEGFIFDTSRVYVDPVTSLASRLTLIESRFGGTSSSFLLDEVESATSAAESAIARTNLMGAENSGGTAFILNTSTLRVGSSGVTLASYIQSLSVDNGEAAAIATTQINASLTPGGSIASAISTVQTTANDAYSAASIALDAVNGEDASITALVTAGGKVTGFRIGGVNQQFKIQASEFVLVDASGASPVIPFAVTGGNAYFANKVYIGDAAAVIDPVTHTISFTNGSARAVFGLGFGAGSDLVIWVGSSSVAIGSATKANAIFAIATDLTTVGVGSGGGGGFSVASSHSAVGTSRLGTGTATTGAVTLTPSGGTAPYGYLWTRTNSDAIVANASTSAATTFTGTITSGGQVLQSLFICTVTDATGKQVTASVRVTISETS